MNPYDTLIGKVVQFTKEAEDFECYAEANMRARIVSVDVSDGSKYVDPNCRLIKIIVDYSEFDEYNQRLESSNYYNKYGIACLNAREAGQYQSQETLYAGWYVEFPPELYFKLVDEKVNRLAEAFRVSGAKNYIEWLESQIDV